MGLIGSTKSDALETITHLLEDRENLYTAPEPEAETFSAYLDSKASSTPPGKAGTAWTTTRRHWAPHPRMQPVSLAPA